MSLRQIGITFLPRYHGREWVNKASNSSLSPWCFRNTGTKFQLDYMWQNRVATFHAAAKGKRKNEWEARNDGHNPQPDQINMLGRRTHSTTIFCLRKLDTASWIFFLQKPSRDWVMFIQPAATVARRSIPPSPPPPPPRPCYVLQTCPATRQRTKPFGQPLPTWAPSSGGLPMDSYWQQASWQPLDWGSSRVYIKYRKRKKTAAASP